MIYSALNVLCHFKNTGKFKHEMMAEVVSMSYLIFLYYQSISQYRSKTRCQNAEKLFWVFQNWVFVCQKVMEGLQNLSFYAEQKFAGT